MCKFNLTGINATDKKVIAEKIKQKLFNKCAAFADEIKRLLERNSPFRFALRKYRDMRTETIRFTNYSDPPSLEMLKPEHGHNVTWDTGSGDSDVCVITKGTQIVAINEYAKFLPMDAETVRKVAEHIDKTLSRRAYFILAGKKPLGNF